jgi:hypothetical protein
VTWALVGGGSDGSTPLWVTLLLGAVSLLLGGGGIVALVRARNDKIQGVAAQETEDENSQASRWKSIADTQLAALIQPLADRLAVVEAELIAIKAELRKSEIKYRSAISYIRILLTWIAHHLPESETGEHPPLPPETVAEDV